MSIQDNQKKRIKGEPLTATRTSRIAYGDTKDTVQITVVNHLMKQETENEKRINTAKKKHEFKN